MKGGGEKNIMYVVVYRLSQSVRPYSSTITIIIRFLYAYNKVPSITSRNSSDVAADSSSSSSLQKKQHGVHVTLSIASSSSTMVVELQLGGRSAAANCIGAKS